MKLHYHPDTDSLYSELRSIASAETGEVADEVLVDLDAAGAVVGFDIDQTSKLRTALVRSAGDATLKFLFSG